ncbi:MAG: hypothetical protein ACLU77_01590 [Waltera sp.]
MHIARRDECAASYAEVYGALCYPEEYVILFLLLVRLLARKKVDVCTYPVALGMLGIGLLMAGTGGVSPTDAADVSVKRMRL